MGRKEVTTTWRQYWIKHQGDLKQPDALSPIFHELKRIVKSFEGKKILEAGSGIGEISIDVCAEGAQTYLLDISLDALVMSKKFISDRNGSAMYINGNIFHLPFATDTFDVVWNAGVVEHFRFDDQVAILKEFRRVVRQDGLVITFNPFAGAKLYRWGKRVAEERGTWEFGEEYPVQTMKQIAESAGLVLVQEYPFLFARQLTFLKHVSPLVFRLYKTAYILSGGKYNPLWQKHYGGYLLASIMRKQTAL